MPPVLAERGSCVGLPPVAVLVSAIEQRKRFHTEDLIGVLVRAEAAGEQLSRSEFLWQCVGTTASLGGPAGQGRR
jgi:hypothetical protein